MQTHGASCLTERIVSERLVFSGNVFDVGQRIVRLPGGVVASRDVVLHKGAAAVVAVDEFGRVAMVRQYRCALNRVVLEIPAGKRDSVDEDPLICARRELREETGLIAGTMKLLSHIASTPGFSSEIISLYLATELTQDTASPDEDEFLEFSWENFEDMLAMVYSGEIGDAKTALGLLLAARART